MFKSVLAIAFGLAVFHLSDAPHVQAASPDLENRIDRILEAVRETPQNDNKPDGPAVVGDTLLTAKFKIDELSTTSCDRIASLTWRVRDNNNASFAGALSKKMKCGNGVCRAVVKAYVYIEDANLANMIDTEAVVNFNCKDRIAGGYPYAPGTQLITLPGQEVPQGGTQKMTFNGKI